MKFSALKYVVAIIERLNGEQHGLARLDRQLVIIEMQAGARIDPWLFRKELFQLRRQRDRLKGELARRLWHRLAAHRVADLLDPAVIDGPAVPAEIRQDLLVATEPAARDHRLDDRDLPSAFWRRLALRRPAIVVKVARLGSTEA